ncbi:MAG: hypothetical protein EP343_01545 [Deltaproteobacteria bacterium]|nr:MAG: hypothetical protein EP343_01545 [Deltaproteobacteria bacterium]
MYRLHRTLFRAICVGCLALGLWVVPWMSVSMAQTQDGTGFQIQQLRQWGDNEGLFQTLSARTLGQWGFKLGMMLNYGKDPLLLRRVSGLNSVRSDNVVEHQMGAEFTAGIGFFDWMDLEIALPVTLYQVGRVPNDGIDSSIVGRQLDGSAVGDMRIGLKFQALTEKKQKFGLGFQIYLGLPTGSADTFNGEETVSFGLRLLAHKTFAKRVRLAFNVGYRYLPETKFVNLTISHELTYGLGLNVDVYKQRVNLIAEVAGAAGLVGGASEYTSPLELLAGARFFPFQYKMDPKTGERSGHQLAVNVGFGLGMLPGYGTPQFRVFLGVNWARTSGGGSGSSGPVVIQDKRTYVNIPKIVTVANVQTIPYPIFLRIQVLELEDIVFGFDKLTFFEGEYQGKPYSAERAQRSVDVAARVLKKILGNSPNRIICVAGHAGVKGIPKRKQWLSDQRAAKLKRLLAEKGIDENKMVTRGYSDKYNSPGTTATNRIEQTMDRRVRIFVLPPGQITCPANYDVLRNLVKEARKNRTLINIKGDKAPATNP